MKLEKIERKAKETILKYRLLGKKDKVIVAASGGKDSTALMFILRKLGYNIEALTIDVGMGGYSSQSLENVKKFCKEQGIKLTTLTFRQEFGGSLCYIRDAFAAKGMKVNPCALCGVLKRHLLNKYARKLGAAKLATGHNLDDEAQSIMMNFFRNTLDKSARLGPASFGSGAKSLVPRVKPLYFCAEKDIEEYSKKHRFPVKYGICPCSKDVFRRLVGNLLDDYEKTSPCAKENIVSLFIKTLPKLRKKYAGQKLSHCKRCGELSKGSLCRACQIIEVLRK